MRRLVAERRPAVRRLVAEFVGTGGLSVAVIGSGIAASRLSPGDVGVQLMHNAVATGLALAVLIAVLGPVSGAHLNPVVTAVEWWRGRSTRRADDADDVGGVSGRLAAGYVAAQTAGGLAGTVIAHAMFSAPLLAISRTERDGAGQFLGEVVATCGLVVVIVALARNRRSAATPIAVGAYIAAAYWFTSSTSFANPAVTVARAFTDTFTGIAPASVGAFLAAQGLGAIAALGLLAVLYPAGSSTAARRVRTGDRPVSGVTRRTP
jgi:glycerol uptake facilitator-like aquaporin